MTDEKFKFAAEMNRGFLQVLTLLLLDTPMYGYKMLKHLESLGYAIEESTLYPLLRRLEKYRLISSNWSVEGDRPKKFYVISTEGKRVRDELLRVWKQQDTILRNLLKLK